MMKSCQEISFHPIFSNFHRQGIFLQRGIDRRKRWDKITLIKTHLVICYWLAKSKGQKPDLSHSCLLGSQEGNSSHSPLLTQNPKRCEKKESSGERENQTTKQGGRKTSFPETKKRSAPFFFSFSFIFGRKAQQTSNQHNGERKKSMRNATHKREK